eukprot:CAMPEP_0202978160 /NCGR_PEP_ID=MMETSP1396-20130829/84674_1 /ASSEMBLY_ACC=CAM_ASM_000872 /TAXON_ID= /ORGANISM="Pseudokeronopsis sp., Strain Brazil" /LENGTH=120 /DNA_ID=CAMNT_0049717035 /DNA_START=412 /DNA_END=774 /DNA_ORIENTATION=+
MEFYEQLFKKIMDTLPRNHEVGLIVNNAGLMSPGYLHLQPLKAHTDMLDVNVMHVALLSKKFVSYFLSARSSSSKSGLINVSSLIGYFPGACGSVYSASKGFVNFFTHPLAFELQGKVDV